MDIVAVPLKPFGIAKARLASDFSGDQRATLGMATAARTIGAVLDAIGEAYVVTANDQVADWAINLGASIIEEEPGRPEGLNGAAQLVTTASGRGRWMVVHADLPLVTPKDIRVAWENVPSGGVLLAPSSDGGTSVLAGNQRGFTFSYGPGSFARHLARSDGHPVQILTRLGFLLDLDDPSDFAAAIRHPRGAWLADAVDR